MHNIRCCVHAVDWILKTAPSSDKRPRDFKDAQQPRTSEDADADWIYQVQIEQRCLGPAADDHNEIEPVEHRSEVAQEPDCVHLDEHLNREQRDEEQVGHFCNKVSK